MKILVGEYIRTKDGQIIKIDGPCDMHYLKEGFPYFERDIESHNFNLKKLIKIGDYINGFLIEQIDEFKDGSISFNSEPVNFCEIKNIVTKEQFEKIKYKVEKED